MKNSLVDKERNKNFRLVIRLINLSYYFLVLMATLGSLYQFIKKETSFDSVFLMLFIFLVYTFIISKSQLFRRNAKCLKYLKKYFDYKKLDEIISKESFNPIGGITDFKESENWLQIDEYFIPKNFILGSFSHIVMSRYSSYRLISFPLITGNVVYYDTGTLRNKFNSDKEEIIINALAEKLPHASIDEVGSIRIWFKENKKNIENKFIEFVNSGEDVYDLIENYRNISGHIKSVNSAIDDSEEYFKEYKD